MELLDLMVESLNLLMMANGSNGGVNGSFGVIESNGGVIIAIYLLVEFLRF